MVDIDLVCTAHPVAMQYYNVYNDIRWVEVKVLKIAAAYAAAKR